MKFKSVFKSFSDTVLKVATITGLVVTNSVAPLSAAVVGVPEKAEKGKFAVSVEGEYNSGRELKTITEDSWQDYINMGDYGVDFNGKASINSKLKNDRIMAKIGYNALKNLTVYGKIGTVKGKLEQTIDGLVDWRSGEETGTATLSGTGSSKLNNGLAYGGGATLSFDLPKGLFLGTDVQEIFQKNKYSGTGNITYIDNAGGGSASYNIPLTGNLSIQELQVTPFVGIHIGKATLCGEYIYNKLSVEDKSGQQGKVNASKNSGFGGSFNWRVSKHINASLEGGVIGKNKMIGTVIRIQ